MLSIYDSVVSSATYDFKLKYYRLVNPGNIQYQSPETVEYNSQPPEIIQSIKHPEKTEYIQPPENFPYQLPEKIEYIQQPSHSRHKSLSQTVLPSVHCKMAHDSYFLWY